MVIQFEFENKKKKKFSGGGIFLMPYGERQSGVVGSGMSIDEHKKLLLEALNAPLTKSLQSSGKRSGSSAVSSAGEGFVQVKL